MWRVNISLVCQLIFFVRVHFTFFSGDEWEFSLGATSNWMVRYSSLMSELSFILWHSNTEKHQPTQQYGCLSAALTQSWCCFIKPALRSPPLSILNETWLRLNCLFYLIHVLYNISWLIYGRGVWCHTTIRHDCLHLYNFWPRSLKPPKAKIWQLSVGWHLFCAVHAFVFLKSIIYNSPVVYLHVVHYRGDTYWWKTGFVLFFVLSHQ